MGERDVEKELGDALERMAQKQADEFRILHQNQAAGFARLEAITDKAREEAQKHYLEDARIFSRLEESTKAAHIRIDKHESDHRRERVDIDNRIAAHVLEHNQEKQSRVQLWIGVFLALLGSVLAWLFGGKK